MLRSLAVLVVLASFVGCSRAPNCLTSRSPRVGRPAADEQFALMRRELGRAGNSPAWVRAHVIETLPSLFPDVSDLSGAPTCDVDLVNRLEKVTFREEQVVYSRLLIARIRAVSRVAEIASAMKAKARFLIRVAKLSDGELSEYQKSEGEGGESPDKGMVRRLAILSLLTSGVRVNVPEVEPFIRDRAKSSADDDEVALFKLAQEAKRSNNSKLFASDTRVMELRRSNDAANVSRRDRMTRVGILDRELRILKFAPSRCHVLRELAYWLPDKEQERRFDGIVDPVFDGNSIRFSTENLCRIRAALSMNGVDASRRIRFALRVLRTAESQISKRDLSRDGSSPGIAFGTSKALVWLAAGESLAKHPDWVDTALVRDWLDESASSRAFASGDPEAARFWLELQPAYERLMATYSFSGDQGDVTRGRRILAEWISTTRVAFNSGDFSNTAVLEVLQNRLVAIGEFATPLNLVTQAQALFDEMAGSKKLTPQLAEALNTAKSALREAAATTSDEEDG